MSDQSPDDAQAEFLDLFRQLCRPERYGWKRTTLSADQLDYIVSRNDLIRAIKLIQEIDPICYTTSTKENALKLREHALHALACISWAMRDNEERMMGNGDNHRFPKTPGPSDFTTDNDFTI